MATELPEEPWEALETLLQKGDADQLRKYLDALSSGEIARALSRLDQDARCKILTQMTPAQAADLLLELSETQAAELLEELTAAQAGAILDHVPSDEQADLLGLVQSDQSEAILANMSPAEAADVRALRQYPEDTAGGIMVTEFLSYPETGTVADVVQDIRKHAEKYAGYDVQYAYVTSAAGKLVGVLRLRDLLLSQPETPLSSIMQPHPHCLPVATPLDDLRSFFDRHAFFGAPVTDDEGRLVGVVLRADVEEAVGEKADQTYLQASVVVGGEEFRTMPLLTRTARRLSWLTVSVVLNLIAASVIGLYQETLTQVIALAIFLPVISGISGSSGNQAIAVSMRELALGLVKPYEIVWVVLKEASVGLITGAALGLLLAAVASIYHGSPYLGLVVGGALTLNNLVAVCLGGAIPLLLKQVKLDPALAAGPILMTLADMCGFFLALNFATALMTKLTA